MSTKAGEVQIEAAIERYYGRVHLDSADRTRIQVALEEYLGEQAAVSQQEIARCQGVLDRVMEEERKLLQAHYQDRVSPELFAAEQARIGQERKAAECIIARLSLEGDDLEARIAQTFQLATANLQSLYLQASPMVRRFMNQALFEALWVCHDDISEALLSSPFQEVRDLAAGLEAASQARETGSRPARGPCLASGRAGLKTPKSPSPRGKRGFWLGVRLEPKWWS